MSLTLRIENLEKLDNGEPTLLKLDRHGAVIGRSPHSDWSLPDPKNYVSSTHCEIDYRDGAYILIDKSTNGTSINESKERLAGPHTLQDGDLIVIGHYRIRATTKGGASAASQPSIPAPKGGWAGWDDLPGPGDRASEAKSSGWDAPSPPPAAANPAWGEAAPSAAPSSAWGDAAPAAAPASAWDDPAPSAAPASAWDSPAPPPPAWGETASAPSFDWGAAPKPAASAWGSPPSPIPAQPWSAEPASPSSTDAGAWGAVNPAAAPKSGWDALSTGGKPETPVDAWTNTQGSAVSGRGPMAQNWSAPRAETAPVAAERAPPAADADDVWGRFTSSNTVDWARGGFGDPAPAPQSPAISPSVAPTPVDAPMRLPSAPTDDGAWQAFLAASGVPADLLKGPPREAGAAAGAVMKRLVAGLVVMLEARARAKAQLGAQSTTLELSGNNPLKFARSPDRVLAQLLNPPERGFMEPGRAVEDSFQDLQAHQMATLAAMQGALRSTLERFSPDAIGARAETRGLLAKILPSARNAALWEAYVKEFDGVARGSEEAFLDIFSKAFKAAYEKAAADMKRGMR